MKALLLLSPLLVLVSSISTPQKIDYNGAQVVRLGVAEHVDLVQGLVDRLSLRTWGGAISVNRTVDIVVMKNQTTDFFEATKELESTFMHEDLGASISAQERYPPYRIDSIKDGSWFNTYHRYRHHQRFLEDLQSLHPDQSELVIAGKSVEGRSIVGIHIHNGQKGGKPAIVFHGTIHAREWISTMITEYVAYALLSDCEHKTGIGAALENYDFYIFPVANPDGFAYTKTLDRLWRKSRQVTNASSPCVGIDLNRNWPAFWDVPGGSSTDLCSNLYRGPSAGVAPEIKAHTQFMQKLAGNGGIQLFIDWHSYGQQFMFPYGYTCEAKAATDGDLRSLASGAVEAIRKIYGTEFLPGTTCEFLSKVAGESSDYAYEVAKARYAYTVELRDGGFGFVLPADQIVPSCVESLEGVKSILNGMER